MLLPEDQLDSLEAPIALYPDPLLSQTLVASTYPLEIIQLQQWLERNKNLKDKALADAVMKQGWDPSIQAMAALPVARAGVPLATAASEALPAWEVPAAVPGVAAGEEGKTNHD